jgi:hypothetical protein
MVDMVVRLGRCHDLHWGIELPFPSTGCYCLAVAPQRTSVGKQVIEKDRMVEVTQEREADNARLPVWTRVYSHSAFWPVMVFLLSFCVRLLWSASATITPVSDCHGYDLLAQGLSNGEDYGVFNGESRGKAYRTPGYPGFLAAIYTCFGHSYRAVGFVQAFFSALTTLLLFFLSLRFVKRRASLFAAGLHAFSPTFLAYVPILASETLATFLGIGALLLICSRAGGEQQCRYRWVLAAMALSGALMGLNLLVRPSGLFFVPGLVLVIALRGDLNWRRRAVSGAIFLLAISAVLSPWLVRSTRLGFGLTLTTNGGWNLYMGNNDKATKGGHLRLRLPKLPEENAAEYDRRHAAAALDWIRMRAANPW